MNDEGARVKKKAPPLTEVAASESVHPSSFILHPSKRRFGQNFLVDRSVIDRIISAVNAHRDETIIEIGPGRGALTLRLTENTGRLIAIEFDRELVPVLREQFKDTPNLQLIEDDALNVNFCEVIEPARSARVVANLPYNIAAAGFSAGAQGLEYRCPLESQIENRRGSKRRKTLVANRERGFRAASQDDS